MTFKSIAEFLDARNKHNPTSAKRKLIKAAQAGEPCRLFDPEQEPARPNGPDDKVTIRANLLRLLILGGTKDCGLHQRGVWLEGGWIEGKLDAAFCEGMGQTILRHCQFDLAPDCNGATFKILDLLGSSFPGLLAKNTRVLGSVILGNIVSIGKIDFSFSRIDGQLDLRNSEISGGFSDGLSPFTSLKAEHLVLGSDLLLIRTKSFGTVDLTHAIIQGQLDCTGATLDCGVDPSQIVPPTRIWPIAFNSNSIGNSVTSIRTNALSAQRLHVERGFVFRNIERVNGHVVLHGAHIGDLLDDVDSWPKGESRHLLAGFTYNRFGVSAPASIANRLEWLKRGVESYPAYAQPYTHLAKVLRSAGHAAEARRVLIERERLLAAHSLASDWQNYQRALHGDQTERGDAGWIWLLMRGAQLWSWLTGKVAGYGYAPQYALYWALAFIGVSFFAYMGFWRLGAMVPTDAVILTSAEWLAAYDMDALRPALIWADPERSGPATSHYETYYSLTYALDVFLPIVDLGQQSTWGQTTVTWAGWFARIWTWGLQIAGYVITSLGLAAATGIIQRNQPD